MTVSILMHNDNDNPETQTHWKASNNTKQHFKIFNTETKIKIFKKHYFTYYWHDCKDVVLEVPSMMTHHFGVRCHHQLHIARIGEEALASAWGSGSCAGGVVFIHVPVIYCHSERVQLLSHIPCALKGDWPLGVLCFKRRRRRKKMMSVELD